MRRLLLLNCLLLAAWGGLSGCSTMSAVGTVANAALELSGIKKPAAPELPDAQKPPRNIAIKLHAADNLNLDASGRPLAVVARIYKLKQSNAFQLAPYDTFLNQQKEREVFGSDLVEVKEVTLIPGQKIEMTEKVSKEAEFVGVVALFRAPAPQRWRAAFPAGAAEKSGITIGMHACAMTVGTGTTVASEGNAQLLGPVRCQ